MIFILSLERLDVKIGFVKSNVVLICREFNTTDLRATHDVLESSGWTKEKWQYVQSLY